MESIIGDIKENPNIFQLLTSFLSRNDYLVDHSILNIYFSSYILSKLGWSNEQTLKQMVYACFLHDIALDTPEEARVEDLSKLEDRELRARVKNHGQEAAKILEQINGINHDAHKIIMDHHEKPDGSGFPQGLKANQIPPLSCVFLISHHIIDFLCREEFRTENLATFFQSMEPTWGQDNFKRVYNCTRKILLD